MSSEWELNEGIKSIKSAWWREHTARANLKKMLENAEAENAKLRELVRDLEVTPCCRGDCWWRLPDRMRELGIEVEGCE